jgi:hypothetical protein
MKKKKHIDWRKAYPLWSAIVETLKVILPHLDRINYLIALIKPE